MSAALVMAIMASRTSQNGTDDWAMPMHEELEAVWRWLVDDERHERAGPKEASLDATAPRAATGEWLCEAKPQQLDELLQGVDERLEQCVPRRLHRLLSGLVQARRAGSAAWHGTARMRHLAERLPADSQGRALALQWLALDGRPESLAALADGLVEFPPDSADGVALAMSPLWQFAEFSVDSLFPRLFDALGRPTVAAPVLDLANFLCRERLQGRHPGAEHAERLAKLLGQITEGLARIEEQGRTADAPQDREAYERVRRIVQEGVPLAVSLCDALALIGDERHRPRLERALELGHRRIRTEAAWGLAKLGDEAGRRALCELCAEPVARLRALHYAEELGIIDDVAAEHRTPQAVAEAELTSWLAEPTQIGFPPARLELVDHRQLCWPGYDDPLDCWLFRYVYELPGGTTSNIAIAGPLTHAFSVDLADLAIDDIYAAFAGWHAEHEEIREFPVERLGRDGELAVERLKRRLVDLGMSQLDPVTLGEFFGEQALVARAVHEGAPGVAVVDPLDLLWLPDRPHRAPFDPADAFCIYKGRRLLKAFNG